MGEIGGKIVGRGAKANPKNRFESFEVEWEAGELEAGAPALRTRFYDDQSESIITYNKSPDIPFTASLNPYRGCEHGCSYCYARPFHEYLGFSAGLDFESKIMVKRRAAELLRQELGRRKWEPQLIAMSGVTDPYQPVEKKLRITRECLEVLRAFRNPVGIVTKNRLVTRDADVLGEMAVENLCSVTISLNSLDADLARRMEPRTSSPKARFEAIATLAEAGVPVGIFVAPVVPGLNDHEIPAILQAAADAGAQFASYILLRLPHGVESIFLDWLEANYPGKRGRVESRLRELRGGKLNRSEFGERFRGQGIFAEQLRQLFSVSLKRAQLAGTGPELATDRFRRPPEAQMDFGF